MATVALFDMDTETIDMIKFPFGKRMGTLTTREGYHVWKRDDMVVFGTLNPGKDAVITMFGTRKFDDDKIDELQRPSSDKVFRAFLSLGSSSDKSVASHDTELESLKKELQAFKDAQVTELPVVTVLPVEKAKTAEDFYTLFVKTLLDDINGKVESVRKRHPSAVIDIVDDDDQPPRKKVKGKGKAVKKPISTVSTAAKSVFKFQDNDGSWKPVFSEINDVLTIFNSNATPNGITFPHGAKLLPRTSGGAYVVEVPYGEFNYLFTMTSAGFTQQNKDTGASRLIKKFTSNAPGPSGGDPSELEAKAALDVVAGSVFPSTVPVEINTWKFDASADSVRLSDDPQLKDLCATLATTTAKFTNYEFKYDPAKTEIMIKPTQLQTIISQMQSTAKFMRVVFHATDITTIQKIKNDARGVDIATGSTSCRYGKSIYLGTTLCPGEVCGHNKTRVKGKTIMCLLVSPYKDPMTNKGETSFIFYSYACMLKKASGNYNEYYNDAIAMFDQSFLLPLAVVSP